MKGNHAIVINSGYRCENGSERERNEDSCLALTAEYGGHFPMQTMGLYIVADGMGGEHEGHVASNTATRAFAEHILANLYLSSLRQRPMPSEIDLLDLIEGGVFVAHDAVLSSDSAAGPGQNGGTTLTAGLILGRRLYIAHVGDTRAYLHSGIEMRPLTEDHSLVRRLQETGRLKPEDAEGFQYRHVLLQALGQDSALTADTFSLDLPARGKLLICSDGLCGLVSVEVMAGILRSEGTAQEMADRLYAAAMSEGGHDNITAIVVDFSL